MKKLTGYRVDFTDINRAPMFFPTDTECIPYLTDDFLKIGDARVAMRYVLAITPKFYSPNKAEDE